MKKITLITILLISAIWSGCGGTRNTNTQHKDSIHIENNYSQGTKIVLGNSFTYTPFDALKPMKIEGKVYENAIVSNDKSKTITKWKDRHITKTITVEKKKQTIRKDNTWLYLGLFFVLVLFVFLWFYLPKIKTGI